MPVENPNPQQRARRNLLTRAGGLALTVVMSILLVLFVAMTVLRFSGGELLAVRTGSMEPSMAPGDLLVSREVDPRAVQTDDVITFRVPSADNTLVTHRVIEVLDDGNSFRTQGDANEEPDPFTTAAEDVLGAEWFTVPGVGRAVVFLAGGPGTALLLGIPAAIYIGQSVADRRRRSRESTIQRIPVPVTAAPGDPGDPPGPTVPAVSGPTALPIAVPVASLPAELRDQLGGQWALVTPLAMAATPPPYRPGSAPAPAADPAPQPTHSPQTESDPRPVPSPPLPGQGPAAPLRPRSAPAPESAFPSAM